MEKQYTEPGYLIRYVKSASQTYAKVELDSIASEIKDGYIVFWQFNKILTGKILNGIINWLSEKPDSDLNTHFYELRAFNNDMEIRLWRNEKNEIVGRKRIDHDIKDEETEGYLPITEPKMLLRGVVGQYLKTNSNDEYAVVTRQYIDFNEIGQAGYIDYRFVKFVMH